MFERVSSSSVYIGTCCWVIGVRDKNGNYGLAYTDGCEIWGFNPCGYETSINVGK